MRDMFPGAVAGSSSQSEKLLDPAEIAAVAAVLTLASATAARGDQRTATGADERTGRENDWVCFGRYRPATWRGSGIWADDTPANECQAPVRSWWRRPTCARF